MKRYYARLRAGPAKSRSCFICGDARHADLALDFGKTKIYASRACLEGVGAVVSLVGDEALRSFVGTALGNLASVAVDGAFGPQLRQLGSFITGARLLGGSVEKQQPEKSEVIDVDYEVVPREEKP